MTIHQAGQNLFLLKYDEERVQIDSEYKLTIHTYIPS